MKREDEGKRRRWRGKGEKMEREVGGESWKRGEEQKEEGLQ